MISDAGSMCFKADHADSMPSIRRQEQASIIFEIYVSDVLEGLHRKRVRECCTKVDTAEHSR